MPKAPRRRVLSAKNQPLQRKELEKKLDSERDARTPDIIQDVNNRDHVNHGYHTINDAGNIADAEDVNCADDMEGIDDMRNAAQAESGLGNFLKFCHASNISLHEKVLCTNRGVSANYGMVAIGDIKTGETLFIIPRTAVLSPENCGIAKFLASNAESLSSNSGWLPLILAILYEKFDPESKWRAYLDTFPNFTNMDLPMFWPLSELESELKCTGLASSVATDIHNMRKEYDSTLLPLITEHPELFKDPRYRDFDVIKQVCAFIMAYSFTDDVSRQVLSDSDESDDEEEMQPPATLMVPLADLLNHVPDHNAELNIGESTLRMIAVKDIKKGEEVYNTYGKVSNYTLLLMYGFAVLPQTNPYNTLELKLSTIDTACIQTDYPNWELRSEYLKKLSAADAQDSFSQSICLHSSGLSDTAQILKVLRMDKEELQARLSALKPKGVSDDRDGDDWLSDDEEEEEITSDDLCEFDEATKAMLRRVADLILAEFPPSLPTALQGSGVSSISLSNRQVFSMYVRDSQTSLLIKLKQWLV
ncbi:N-lysine methyltransferase setd6-like isoform X2 [Watersipora subatra]|uniref:N-lysine methyltransferase setd6-like isoform X2 n=1 Tax=Watersipora subatra TaxID=2589382 RepID=UPI00355C7A64